MRSCWKCGQAEVGESLFCPHCESLQPPSPGRDHFQTLEVPRTLRLDPQDLEASFKRLSRLLHPDRFATASPRERRFSMEHATQLNDAWRVLRVPVKRAEYLLGLWGRPVGEGPSQARQLPLEFLEEVMELREGLAEARFSGDQATMTRLLDNVIHRWQTHYQGIQAAFARAEAASPDPGSTALTALEQDLHTLRYLQGILTEYGMTPEEASPSR